MKVVTNIEGLPELLKAMEELPKSTNRTALTKVLKEAGKPTLDAFQNNAPRDTGFTSESFQISTRLNPRNRRDVAREGKSFAEVYVGTRRGSAATKLEWGTVHMAPRPWLRPGWENTKFKVLKTIERETWEVVKKAAERRAKKLAKG